jgi:hypothetical protein
MSTSAPKIRTVNALAPPPPPSTEGFFRALEDADYKLEQREALQARVDELEAELATYKQGFTLTINTEHDSFQGDPLREIKRMLTNLTALIHTGGTRGVMWDCNGVNTGEWVLHDRS